MRPPCDPRRTRLTMPRSRAFSIQLVAVRIDTPRSKAIVFA